VLHCNGRIEVMREISASTPALAGSAGERAARALAFVNRPKPFDRAAAREELVALVTDVGWVAAS